MASETPTPAVQPPPSIQNETPGHLVLRGKDKNIFTVLLGTRLRGSMASETPTPAAQPPASIHNETPRHLVLRGKDNNVLTLAPLERTEPLVPSTLGAFNFQPLQQKNILRVLPLDLTSRVENLIGILIGLGFVLAFAKGALDTALGEPSAGGAQSPQTLWGKLEPWYWPVAGVLLAIVMVVIYLTNKRSGKALVRGFMQALILLLILAVGSLLPGLAIYWFGGGHELLQQRPIPLLVLGRVLQLLLIAVASLIPGLLYFLFDRQCLATLRVRFQQAIFRLDPTVTTLTDVRAKYGGQMDEIYGPEDTRSARGRLVPGTRLPIFVTTLVITLGWFITLAPVGASDVPVEKRQELLQLFVPFPSAITYAFLGAYFFSLTDILRRYVRGDLKPKAYSSISVRVLVVVILAWVLDRIVTPASNGAVTSSFEGVKLAFIFLVGIVPETGLTFIREFVRPRFGKLIAIPQEENPLTDLDGVDLYDRTRLLDEGVTNIESLAHHDFIDLMMETRIPVARLVDWVDQAILYLHVREGASAQPTSDGGTDLRTRLRNYGIRTATDLLQVCEAATQRNGLATVLQALSGQPDTDKTNRIQVIVDSLLDDEWRDYVSNWRKNTGVLEETYDIPATAGAAEVT